jgi:hypothetical protein
MKTDKFTKTVLTVIAINLTILTVKNLDLIPKSFASKPTIKTELSKNANYGLVPLNEDGTVNARISSMDVIDVRVQKVDQFAFDFCTVPVRIK